MASNEHTDKSDFCHQRPIGKSDAIGRSSLILEALEIALRAVHAELDRPGDMPDDVYVSTCARSWKIKELAAATPALDGRSLLAKIRILEIAIENDIDIACECAGSVRDLVPAIACDVERLADCCHAI